MNRTLVVVAGLLSLALGGAARAADAPPDPEALLRRARTTESADRDIPKAIEQYEAALAAAKNEASATVARDAALRLLHLREARGEREEALRMATRLWTDLGARLAPEQVAVVRAALTRLLAPGQSVTGPNGTIVVDAPGRTEALSPLERTILEQLRSLKGLEGDRRGNRENDISNALRGVGRDALPALEKAIRSEGPDVAPFAASLYAQLGGVEAFPLLLSLLQGTDPFARAAAAAAVHDVSHGDGDREAYVAGLARMMTLPAMASERAWLRATMADNSTPEELFERAKGGGPDAGFWLGRAIQIGYRPAMDLAIAQAREGHALSDDLVGSLGQEYGIRERRYGGGSVFTYVSNDALALEDRLLVLDLLAAQPASEASSGAIASVAAACAHDPAEKAAGKAAEAAWRHALAIADPAQRDTAARELALLGIGPPPAVLEDGAEAYAQVLARGAWADVPWLPVSGRALLGGPLATEPSCWQAVAKAIAEAKTDTILERLVQAAGTTLGVEGGVPRTPPPDADALWVPLLRRLPPETYVNRGAAQWLYRAAARSGDPRFLAWLRDLPDKVNRRSLVDTVAAVYRGPGRRELALDSLTDARLYSQALVQEEAREPEFWSDFLGRAARYDEARLRQALSALGGPLAAVVQGVSVTRGGLAAPGPLPGPFGAAARPEWVDVWRRPEFHPAQDQATAAMIARLAAASGTPAFLALLRERGTGPDATSGTSGAFYLYQALPYYGAAIPVDWIEGLLRDPGVPTGNVDGVLSLLRGDPSPEARAARIRLAKTPTSPAARMLLGNVRQDLGEAAAGTVLEILDSAARGGTEGWPQGYRWALVNAAGVLRLKEAIPFLLTQYQGDLEAAAAQALDAIRAYHERLATFQSWAKDVAEGRRDLSKLLADPDPEIRRAAVLSLGALGDRDALPALVRIAKEEKDPKVRAAALEAVERIARSPAPAPAPAPPAAPKSD